MSIAGAGPNEPESGMPQLSLQYLINRKAIANPAEIYALACWVRFWWFSRPDLLNVSITGFDPMQASALQPLPPPIGVGASRSPGAILVTPRHGSRRKNKLAMVRQDDEPKA